MPARRMQAVRRYVRMDTILITPIPARRTASTVRNGSLAECLSVSAPGITGGGDTVDTTADTMVARGTTDAGTMGAAIMGADTLEDEDMPADMQVTCAAADTMVAQFTAVLDFTAAEAVASTVAVDMVAGTGNLFKA